MSAHKKQVGIFDDVCRSYHKGNVYSLNAHKSSKEQHAKQRQIVLAFITGTAELGATCDEIEQALLMTHQAASARCTELKALGFVCDSGRTRKTRSGRLAAVLVRAG